MDTILSDYEYPAADGGNYGFRVLSTDGYACRGVNVTWSTGTPVGVVHEMACFKLSYRYRLAGGREASRQE